MIWSKNVVIAAVIGGILVVSYFAWSVWGHRPAVSDNGFQKAAPAVEVPKVPGPTVQIKVVPKAVVRKKFPDAHIDSQDEVIDTAEIESAPNGATAITTISPVTGEATTRVKAKDAPWFALERDNFIGVGYEVGTLGSRVPVYYRRAILRVKDAHLIAEVGGKIAMDPREKSEAHAGAILEVRF